MKKYAVGVCPMEEDNKVVIVECENELEAMVKAVGNAESWNIEGGKIPFNTVSDGIGFYLQGEVAVSPPIEI